MPKVEVSLIQNESTATLTSAKHMIAHVSSSASSPSIISMHGIGSGSDPIGEHGAENMHKYVVYVVCHTACRSIGMLLPVLSRLLRGSRIPSSYM